MSASQRKLLHHTSGLLGFFGPVVLLVANLRPLWSYSVDDAFISFRFARNLARGAGLVYNLGERIEGYTNFLWTVILAGLYRCGADIELASKIMGAIGAVAAVVALYGVCRELGTRFPLAPWLLASSVVQTAFASSGMETELFVALVVAGFWRWLVERRVPSLQPWSGMVFAVATLVRPEGILFVGCMGLAFLDEPFPRMLRRAALFTAPVLVHLLWRHGYYGEWLPQTFFSKAGHQGKATHYLASYAWYILPSLAASLVAGWAVVTRQSWRRPVAAAALITVTFTIYLWFSGPDWMPGWRYLAPVEPFVFLATDLGLSFLIERRSRLVLVFGVVCLASFAVERGISLRRAQVQLVFGAEHPWLIAKEASQLVARLHPSLLAAGDIGRIGWETDVRILDLYGLVDRRMGSEESIEATLLVEKPDLFLLATLSSDCKMGEKPSQKGSAQERILGHYQLIERLQRHDRLKVYWCFYQRR